MTHRRDIKRQFVAQMLLIVFGTMLVMSSFHVHSEYTTLTTDCTECEHNIHHSGHLTAAVLSLDDCVLCQFAVMTYLPAVVSVAFFFITLFHVDALRRNQTVVCVCVETGNLRGPPYLV